MFRLSIRELLMLTTVTALAIGWWLDFRHTRRVMASERHYIELITEQMKTKLAQADFRVKQAETIARLNRYLPILATHPPGSLLG